MYHVVFLEADDCFVTKIVFRSKNLDTCWNFILFRLQSDSRKVRNSATRLYVVDSLNQFCDPPNEVRLLKNYHKQQNCA